MYACHCCLVHTEVIKRRLTLFFFLFSLSRSTVPLRTRTRCMARPIWNTCKTSLVPHTLLAFKHAYKNGTGFFSAMCVCVRAGALMCALYWDCVCSHSPMCVCLMCVCACACDLVSVSFCHALLWKCLLIDNLRKSRGLHSVSAYRHGLYI